MAIRKVKGTLVFQAKVDGGDKPLHNTLLELWDLDLIKNDYLAMGKTGIDGTFEISYDTSQSGWLDEPDLVLRVLQREYFYDKDGQPTLKKNVVASFEAGRNVTDALYDFGTVRVSFWEYENPEDKDAVAFTPRVKVLRGETPQSQRVGRKAAQLSAVVPIADEHIKCTLINKFNENRPTFAQIAKYYPPNVTQKMDAESTTDDRPSRSDAYFVDVVQNGFNPCQLRKGADGLYYVSFKWNGYEQDGVHFGPNTTAYFSLESDTLSLEKISVQKRVGGDPGAHAAFRAAKSYTKADGEVWDRVKHLFRCNSFVFGEATTHLGETHLNMEQYIVPIIRNLHDNPVGRLLIPHFYGTVAINYDANDLLITEKGLVAATSPGTPSSVGAIVRDAFGGYNWYGWKPRNPLGKSDRFAQITNIYWKMLGEYIDDYFAENDAAIRANWLEVHRMSAELVAHALPYLEPDPTGLDDTNEFNTADKPHPMVNDMRVAVSPVTESDVADDEGIANLKQVCRYLLFFCTLKHKWVNDSQYDLGGDVAYATLGVVKDITNMEVDMSTIVPAKEAIVHPFYTWVLSYTKYGYIMKNEDNDMNPALIKRLVKYRGELSSLGLDIRDIRCTINI